MSNSDPDLLVVNCAIMNNIVSIDAERATISSVIDFDNVLRFELIDTSLNGNQMLITATYSITTLSLGIRTASAYSNEKEIHNASISFNLLHASSFNSVAIEAFAFHGGFQATDCTVEANQIITETQSDTSLITFSLIRLNSGEYSNLKIISNQFSGLANSVATISHSGLILYFLDSPAIMQHSYIIANNITFFSVGRIELLGGLIYVPNQILLTRSIINDNTMQLEISPLSLDTLLIEGGIVFCQNPLNQNSVTTNSITITAFDVCMEGGIVNAGRLSLQTLSSCSIDSNSLEIFSTTVNIKGAVVYSNSKNNLGLQVDNSSISSNYIVVNASSPSLVYGGGLYMFGASSRLTDL